MNVVRMLALMGVLTVLSPSLKGADGSKLDEYLIEGNNAFKNARIDEALTWIDKAIKVAPENPRSYFAQGQVYMTVRRNKDAIASFTKVVELEPRAVDAYHNLGELNFKLGHIKESIVDFNREIELAPSREPHHWQRGLSFYYAGMYDEGKNQFELHRSVNPNDVENAVWHFLCVAREDGLEAARKQFIPIKGDARVPMMEVHRLFGGEGTVDEVMEAVGKGNPSRAELQQRNFFAHLYLALFYDISGDEQTARYHIDKATGEFSQKHYMGDVARVHKMVMDGKTSTELDTQE